jgi:hypothetical protein
MAGAAPAMAVVTEVPTGGGEVTIGAQPRSTELLTPGAPIASFDNAAGHPVMHSNNTYAIYWDPRYYYHGDWQHLIDVFLQNVGSESGTLGNVFSLDAQYTDKSNQRAAYRSTFRGAYTDTKGYLGANCKDPDETVGYPDEEAVKDNVACITDQQIQEQLQEFIAQNKLQTGMGTIFFVLTPPGVTVCADAGGTLSSHCSDTLGSPNGFCSYHSAISPTSPVEGDAKTILYAVIPWSAGGQGDLHLFDHAPGYECQDGGWNPAGKKGEEREEAMTPAEPAHQQEPDQLPVGSRGPDGSFDTGLADLIINQIAVEQQNTITDPLLNAWHDAAGNEVVDECRNFFALTLGGEAKAAEGAGAGTLYNQEIGSGHYYLNDTFDLAALLQDFPGIPCIPGTRLEPQFTAPDPVNAGDLVGFDASESTTTLDAGVAYNEKGEQFEVFPTYTWSFGDGTYTTSSYPPGASAVDQPSVFHSYQYGGTYDVTLTVTDVGGNTATTSHTVTVDGPPPPPSPGAKGDSASPATIPGVGSGSTPGTAGAPTLTQSVLSRSLSKAIRLGLAVHYSVDRQAAGAVEALLNAATAAHLGIKGRTATGLPNGYPREIVVGSAVLISTRAGQGNLHIRFTKQAAKRLAKVRQVKLTLRFVLRSATPAGVRTTTALSTVVLSN